MYRRTPKYFTKLYNILELFRKKLHINYRRGIINYNNIVCNTYIVYIIRVREIDRDIRKYYTFGLEFKN